MQIVKLEIVNNTFYCPITGTKLIAYDGSMTGMEKSPAMAAVVSDFDETFENEELQELWVAYQEKHDEGRFGEFLKTIKSDRLIAFVVTTGGFGPCGPQFDTITYVLDSCWQESCSCE